MPTRPSYLESYFNILPEVQQKKLLEVVKSKHTNVGEQASEELIQSDLENIISKLTEPLGEPLTKYRKATKYKKISSKDYNSTMNEVYVDLGALYSQDNVIEAAITKHDLLNKTIIRDIRAALRKVENDVKVNTIIKENKSGITDAKYDNFYKDNNQSVDPIFSSWIDTDTNTCKLPKGLDQSVLSIAGLATSDIYLKHYGGGVRGTISREDHRKEKAIDGSFKTFWSEVFLSDEPIVQNYDGVEVYGSVCEVTLRFFRKELINYVRFDPFTNYPLKIIKIKYRPDSGQPWMDIEVGEKSSTSTIEYNFDELEAKEIMIVVNQENPSINTYKIPRTVITNAEMWQQIADRELSISSETTAPIQATQDMIDYITGWQAYSNAVESYGKEIVIRNKDENKDTMAESIFDVTTDQITKTEERGADELKLNVYGKKAVRTDELVEVRKYEYVYGAYEIDVKRLWYLDKGLYLSPRYKANGATLEAEIDVNEVLPSGTSIEYSLTTEGNSWRSVMPSGNYVYRERVDIDPTTKSGILRFPTTSVLLDEVLRNQTVMPISAPGASGGYLFHEDDNTIELRDSWYVGTASYTASYSPSGVGDVMPSGIVVDFSLDPQRDAQDIFDDGASRNFKVELTHNPYLNFGIINDTSEGGVDPALADFQYSEGRWYNRSDTAQSGIGTNEYYDPFLVTVEGYPSENRTDYYNDIRPALTQYDSIQYPYYEYFQAGKNLYFNTKIESSEIKVKYKYLNDFVQFRALLRSNNSSNVTLTPLLEDYTLKLRTI